MKQGWFMARKMLDLMMMMMMEKVCVWESSNQMFISGFFVGTVPAHFRATLPGCTQTSTSGIIIFL